MKSILVVTKEQEVFHKIQTCFRQGYRVDKAASKDAALEMLRKRPSDFVFIDLEILRESVPSNGYKVALEPFWHLYPTIQIIVMSSQKMIREAVMAVKAGADNYLTYPTDPEELKYVTQSLHDSLIAQSELDHLRDCSVTRKALSPGLSGEGWGNLR